jgi:hypothetical protein
VVDVVVEKEGSVDLDGVVVAEVVADANAPFLDRTDAGTNAWEATASCAAITSESETIMVDLLVLRQQELLISVEKEEKRDKIGSGRVFYQWLQSTVGCKRRLPKTIGDKKMTAG